MKTGLTGRTVLLPTDDVAAYNQHVERFFSDHKPATDAEKSLVQSIADTEWRLLRVPALESGIYAVGRRQLAQEFSDEADPAVRAAMIEAQIFMTFRKDLSNIALQEARLRRQRNADLAELKSLQKERIERAAAEMGRAVSLYRAVKKKNRVPFDPPLFGFEFSIEEIEEHVNRDEARSYALGAQSAFSAADFESYMLREKSRRDASK
ncbi:MAG TPA: hypothetical protein VH369_02610 [Bryobacteraceae bacterium]